MSEMKPCPLCGKKAVRVRGECLFHCGDPECRMHVYADDEQGGYPHAKETIAEAITAWNTRPREAELEAEAERLREALTLMREAFCTPLARRAMGGHTLEQQHATLNASAALSHPKGAEE